MRLSQTLALLKPTSEKTASETPPAKDTNGEKTASSPTEEKLKAALKEATAPAAPATEKQAAAPAETPVGDLTKIAAQVASAEQEALIKEANLYGAAIMDGFMARAAQYEAAGLKLGAALPAAPAVTEKQASVSDDFQKFAAENPDLVKEAAELGFARTDMQLEQLKQAAYAKGHDETMMTVYKLAHGSFVQGFEDTSKLLESIGK